MKTYDDLRALIPDYVRPYFKKLKYTTGLDRDDLLQLAYTALHEYVTETGPRPLYSSELALKRVRRGVLRELRAATLLDRVPGEWFRGSVNDRYRAAKGERSAYTQLAQFYTHLAKVVDPLPLDVLQRTHCYDQTPDAIAADLKIDVIEVDALLKTGVEQVRVALADKRWRVLRGDLTGVLDEYVKPDTVGPTFI